MSQLIHKDERGYLELILGPMFSGKSTQLISHIRKYRTIGTKIMIIKPSTDSRYDSLNEICTHNLDKEECTVFSHNELYKIFNNSNYIQARLIAIEEGQFFKDIYEIVKHMVDEDKKIVYVTALNGTFKRELFGDIHKLLSICDNIDFKQALCVECNDGTAGVFSKRIIHDDTQVIVGGSECYKAVCREHYFK